MYVLHALFSEAGSWELWAEDGALIPPADQGAAARPAARAGRGRGKAAAAAPAARHPFAVHPELLAELLGSAGDEISALVKRADPRGAVPVALPSAGAAPLPSSDLAALLPGPTRAGRRTETGPSPAAGTEGPPRPRSQRRRQQQ